MAEFFTKLFDGSDFPARWHCGNWTSGHGWLHIASDLAVFGAYLAIPFVLAYFITRRRDFPFPRLFWLFVAFICFCGLNHLVEAVIFWQPVYRLSGLLKCATAIASWATVVSLVQVMPLAMKLRSPEQLEREVASRTAELLVQRSELDRVNADLVRANDELKQFSYVVSHDLRAPLRAIKAFSELLSEHLGDSLEPEAEQYFHHITGGVTRMEALVRDLLVYSQAEREADTTAIGIVDLTAVTNTIVAEARLARPEDELRFEIGPLPAVRGEVTMFRQVLQNLVDNAVKFSLPGAASIRIRAKPTADGWEISVADDGIGMEPRFADRIFEPFQRLHAQTEYEGTGIGLAIVRRIVRRLGGTVKVESAPGQGSTFSFTIPSEADQAASASMPQTTG